MEIETVILRFRDLVTTNNGTIENHKSIIEQYGYVWWGWWKKGNEKTPVEEFSFLSSKAKENLIEIFLIDSGQNLVYKATCGDIEIRENTACSSPEPKKTPQYYREQQYFVWFKFMNIEPCEFKELRKFSYVECKDLYVDKNTDYSKFNNKKIFSIQELTQQNRTVWFVRKASEKDTDNEIILLNSYFVQPTNFSKKYYQASGDTFIWLSDLHSPDGTFEHKTGQQHLTLAQQLLKELKGQSIGGLLISGDITTGAQKEGFEFTKSMLQDVENDLSLNPENILICPGNHDFIREDKDISTTEHPDYIYKNQSNYKDYEEFYHSIYHLKPNKFCATGKKILLSSGHLVEIVALNSVLLQQYKNFEGHGYLSQEQLDFVAENMGWNTENNKKSIRIVMMHHHYLPASYTETINVGKASSAVYDADRLMSWLTKYNVKLLLHGHKHRSFISQVCYPEDQSKDITDESLKHITVIGMGSTGAQGVENKFATLRFEKESVVVELYRLYGDESSKTSQCQKVNLTL